MATIVSWPDIRERPAPATVFVRFRGEDQRSSSFLFFFVWKSWNIIQGVERELWLQEILNRITGCGHKTWSVEFSHFLLIVGWTQILIWRTEVTGCQQILICIKFKKKKLSSLAGCFHWRNWFHWNSLHLSEENINIGSMNWHVESNYSPEWKELRFGTCLNQSISLDLFFSFHKEGEKIEYWSLCLKLCVTTLSFLMIQW